jgi:hypothetical protein
MSLDANVIITLWLNMPTNPIPQVSLQVFSSSNYMICKLDETFKMTQKSSDFTSIANLKVEGGKQLKS